MFIESFPGVPLSINIGEFNLWKSTNRKQQAPNIIMEAWTTTLPLIP